MYLYKQPNTDIPKKTIGCPLFDRIDLVVHVSRVPNETLLTIKSLDDLQHINAKSVNDSTTIVQHNRYGSSTKYNASMRSQQILQYAPLTPSAKNLLTQATDKLALSTRKLF